MMEAEIGQRPTKSEQAPVQGGLPLPGSAPIALANEYNAAWTALQSDQDGSVGRRESQIRGCTTGNRMGRLLAVVQRT